MGWLSFLPWITSTIVAILGAIKWKHAATANKVNNVLVDAIERGPVAGMATLKSQIRTRATSAGVEKALNRRVRNRTR